MSQTLYTPHQLFLQIAEGDEAAFTLLLDKYWNLIYSQSMAYLKDRFKAQDIVQEVFLAIWKSRHKLPEVESPEDYLFIIARNKIFNEVRKKVAEPITDNIEQYYAEQQLRPDRQFDHSEINTLLQDAISQLPPQRRRIFEMSRNEGLTYEAIASQLGISRETVKVQMVKALSFLRQYIRTHIPLYLFLKFFFNE
ncbi:RNA polymerase sigma factor [Pseudobacter ginsenosidimutans]|uniref:RNA polymerase sigma-70 factor (ECF subfamily) n=1 Tax=Pseudobacter ginsenosidimutans TaxID=661488 RepID=A0A4Q7N582_9BACT|nr:RNA polymerase sigma-70 factor [Pseudobacter ginsenosidimutans]QEC44715.1 RNA polymerase sigma-70 factor [Pseudobacter ginsenosidimutans]RZS76196.1 RNA polymerase sigma-70 factor (ECF subfamily) [Pseudobacter ginsenosidimutans]